MGEDSEMAETAAEKMITALGILIGFSWEQCFDTAVAVVAAGGKAHVPPAVSKLVMSVALVFLVFPAWRLYILKAERELVADDTEAKIKLKNAVGEHRELFLSKDKEEHKLDLAHLKMKQYRREAFEQPHPSLAGKNLTHLQVTAVGITEVEQPHLHRQKTKVAHLKELNQRLLE